MLLSLMVQPYMFCFQYLSLIFFPSQIPGSIISDEGIKFLDSCKAITDIDLSHCTLVTTAGYKAFVKTHSKVMGLT